jgi:hypothetical protein
MPAICAIQIFQIQLELKMAYKTFVVLTAYERIMSQASVILEKLQK